MTHHCLGDDCGYCELRICELEYRRDLYDDVDDFYEG